MKLDTNRTTLLVDRIFNVGRRELAILLAFGIAVRLAAFMILRPEPVSDYLAYYTMAALLADGQTMRDQLGGAALMSGGYPLLLGVWFMAWGKSLAAAHLLNLVLYVVGTLCLYQLCTQLARSRAIGLAGVLLWTVYLESIVYATYVAKENLFAVLLLMQLLLLVYPGKTGAAPYARAVAGGAVFGYALIVGMAYVGFAPAVAYAMWRNAGNARRFGIHAATFSLAAIVVLTPWLARNERVVGERVIATNGGFNLYIGNNPAATGGFVSIIDTPIGTEFKRRIAEDGEAAASNYVGHLARQFIVEQPGIVLQLAATKLARFWMPPTHQGERPGNWVEQVVRALWALQYTAILAVLVCALWGVRRTVLGQFDLALVAIIGYWLLHGAAFVQPRFRLTIMPLVALGAALGLRRILWARSKAHRSSALPQPATPLADFAPGTALEAPVAGGMDRAATATHGPLGDAGRGPVDQPA